LLRQPDSEQLIIVIMRALHTKEKHIEIYVANDRDTHNKKNVSNVGLANAKRNFTDGLIQPGQCPPMDGFIEIRIDRNPVQHWVIRCRAP